MQVNKQKIVLFDKYCPICKHYKKTEDEDPCWECLDDPVNVWSHKPVRFKEAKKK